ADVAPAGDQDAGGVPLSASLLGGHPSMTHRRWGVCPQGRRTGGAEFVVPPHAPTPFRRSVDGISTGRLRTPHTGRTAGHDGVAGRCPRGWENTRKGAGWCAWRSTGGPCPITLFSRVLGSTMFVFRRGATGLYGSRAPPEGTHRLVCRKAHPDRCSIRNRAQISGGRLHNRGNTYAHAGNARLPTGHSRRTRRGHRRCRPGRRVREPGGKVNTAAGRRPTQSGTRTARGARGL